MPLCAYEFWLKFGYSQKHESLLQTISLILFLRKRFLIFFHSLFYENVQAFYEQGKTNTRIQIIFINMQMQAF